MKLRHNLKDNMIQKTVVILGAGNASLFAAHIIKRILPAITINVVGSKEIGIVGVGESSTEHIQHVTKSLGITASEMVKNTGSTFKFGVAVDWHKEPWVHALFGNDLSENIHTEGYHPLYQQFANGDDPICGIPQNCLEMMVHPEQTPNQFHFDTHLLNEYLIKEAERKGIRVFDDKITEFNFREDGSLENVESETRVYAGDYFVDATGFARVLSKKVPEFQWVSKQKDMFCDRAFAFLTEHKTDNYSVFTTAHKMKAGWMWEIPVQHRNGQGYVYSSDFLTHEEAVKEVEDKLGHPVEVLKQFEFEAGHFNKIFHKNMALIGLASHFFEPLEATSMGVGIQQARILTKVLSSDCYDDYLLEPLNKEVQKMFNQMFMFLRLHYHNAVPDSPFWEHVSKVKVPEQVQKLLDIAQHRMLQMEDLNCHLDWYIFHELNFNQVLYCIGALSPEIAKKHQQLGGRYAPGRTFNWNLDDDILSEMMKHKDYVDGLVNGTIAINKELNTQ